MELGKRWRVMIDIGKRWTISRRWKGICWYQSWSTGHPDTSRDTDSRAGLFACFIQYYAPYEAVANFVWACHSDTSYKHRRIFERARVLSLTSYVNRICNALDPFVHRWNFNLFSQLHTYSILDTQIKLILVPGLLWNSNHKISLTFKPNIMTFLGFERLI